MTIRDIVAEPLRIHRLPGWRGRRGDELVGELLAAVGLPGADLRSYPSRYSGGGRQRIAIARALITSPSVLICDEPTSSLDVSVQAQIVNLLLDARHERDLSMLFVTHDLDLIGRVADTVAVMYRGRVVETGPAELIRRSPRHPYTKALHDAVPADHPRSRRLATTRTSRLSEASAAPGVPADLVRESCVFAERCPRTQARCRQERPPMIKEDSLRSYACFFPLSDGEHAS
jgi:peptide/nickel transport system ATP-binding protein